jgi:GH24 family phage-related lysozyme (muramidase)
MCFIEKSAQSFSDDGTTFTLQKGKAPVHAVQEWNNSHPDRLISLKALLEANPGVDPRRYIAGKKYKMPSMAPNTTVTHTNGNRRSVANSDQLFHRVNAAIADTVPFTQSWEKYEPEAYWDDIGKKWTVGHGITHIRDATTGKMRPVQEGDTMTESDSAMQAKRIMRQNAVAMYYNLPWFRKLDQSTMSAVLDKAYNAGWGVFSPNKSPNLNKKMSVPDADPNSVYWSEHDTYASAGGKKNVPGLVNRQKASRKKWGP